MQVVATRSLYCIFQTIKQCFSTLSLRKALDECASTRTNKFAIIPSHNNICINFVSSTFLFIQQLHLHLTSVKKSKICCSTWQLYFWGSVVSSLKLLSKLQFVFAILAYNCWTKAGVCVGNDNYLKLGFTSVVVNGEIQPQLVHCLEVLAHGSLKEA